MRAPCPKGLGNNFGSEHCGKKRTVSEAPSGAVNAERQSHALITARPDMIAPGFFCGLSDVPIRGFYHCFPPRHVACAHAPSPRHSQLQKFAFQACTYNTLAFRAVAPSATHRYRVRRPAPWPRARTGALTDTLLWRGGRAAENGVPPPSPQRRWPAGVVQRRRAGQSHRRAAHLHAADTAHGRADGIDHRAMGRL